MVKHKKILVTGSQGMVGKAIERRSFYYGYQYTFYMTDHRFFDLRDEHDVDNMYAHFLPDYVIHLAAKVGGVQGNMSGPGDFFDDNILMDTYMLKYAKSYNVEKFIGISSVCIFPDCLKILTEDKMHDGPPHSSNFAYAYAKRMMDIQMEAYRKQYGVINYCTIIPTNMYGPNDNYNLISGHVIPSLIHKIYLAKRDNTNLTLWGDGSPRREFLYVDDFAYILLKLLGMDELPSRLLVSSIYNFTIKDIAVNLCNVAGFKGNINYDTTKPMGQSERPTDTSRLDRYFPNMKFTNLLDGLYKSYAWFEQNYEKARK